LNLIAFLVVGLLAGLLARAVFPGRQSMGLLGTMVLGLIGSFIGGAVSTFFFSRGGDWATFQPSGLLWSTVGALLALWVASLAGRRRI
jgi:uncharacterized membrane protein YeaQ/YmgE (transglycosylase-associated protein family)